MLDVTRAKMLLLRRKGKAMAYQEKSGFCKSCDKQVMVRRKGTNHILHLLLTVFTAGIWLPIWLLSCFRFGGWRCTQCGGKKVSRVS